MQEKSQTQVRRVMIRWLGFRVDSMPGVQTAVPDSKSKLYAGSEGCLQHRALNARASCADDGGAASASCWGERRGREDLDELKIIPGINTYQI